MNKLQEWKRLAYTAHRVSLSAAIDLTTPPSSQRASWPYSSLPPFRILQPDDILRELVSIPSIFETGAWAFLMGVVVGVLFSSPTLAAKKRWTLIIAVLSALILYLQTRLAKVTPVSKLEDVSSNPGGPCHVTTRILTLTNSHAGTHADTQFHFSPMDDVRMYDHAQYIGDALLIDLSAALQADPDRKITEQMLKEAAEERCFHWSHVWRLLVATRTLEPNESKHRDEWNPKFAHFTAEAAQFLAKTATNLLLVGIDTPSIDHCDASPICSFSHGTFANADIAILENLDFSHVDLLYAAGTRSPNLGSSTSSSFGSIGRQTPPKGSSPPREISGGSRGSGVGGAAWRKGSAAIRGAMQTIFTEPQDFADAKGCTVLFYPMTDAGNPMGLSS